MYYVYVLLSQKDGRTYTGYARDFNQRLKLHNAGQVRATRYRRPLTILLIERLEIQREAKERERWWKSGSGRKELKRFFKEKSTVTSMSAD